MSRIPLKFRALCDRITAAFFSPKCPSCGVVTGSALEGELCTDCRSAFAEEFVSICPNCQMKPSFCECIPDISGKEWDRSPYTVVMPLIFAGYYTGYREDSIVSTLVYRMKRHRSGGAKLFFARIIAQNVARTLALKGIESDKLLVTYIPRSETAFAEYGFDHMETVAKHVAEMLGCRVVRLLIRRGGVSQKKLRGDERKANAYTSVLVDPAKEHLIRGAKILIIDDVITTGSTMRTAISRLSLAGADTVFPAAAMVSMTGKYNKKK